MADATINKEPAAAAYDNFSPLNKEFYAQSPYKAFNTQGQDIRLLRPLSLTEDGVLSFTLLENCVLDEVRNDYVTLSYCAGSPLVTEVVLVNGLKLNAFGNLHHALWEVIWNWEQKGKQLSYLLLWADQICIDQSNGSERSHQVSQMRDIYASSERVLIVLATKMSAQTPNSGMRWMAQMTEELQIRGCYGLDDKFTSPYTSSGLDEWLRVQAFGTEFISGFQDFLELLRSLWWTRSWVYQEFIVSPDADFLFGAASCNWKGFGAVISHLLRHLQVPSSQQEKRLSPDIYGVSLRRSISHTDIQNFERGQLRPLTSLQKSCSNNRTGFLKVALLMVRRKTNWLYPTDLKGWLDFGRLCYASDPRDKAYAFLGLAQESYNIIVDYSPSNTAEKLLLELAEQIIFVEQNLDLLAYVNHEGTLNVPSLHS